MKGLNISDEELISRYHDGDEAAFEMILEKYKNLVKKKAGALYIAGGDRDDLIQEGMIGLYKAAKTYNEQKECSFVTYASMCINHQMCTAIAKANRKKHEPLNDSVSYDASVRDENGEEMTLGLLISDNDMSNPERKFFDELSADDMIDRILTELSSYEKKVLQLYMDGDGYLQIAACLGKSPKSVDNALNRIRKKVGKLL